MVHVLKTQRNGNKWVNGYGDGIHMIVLGSNDIQFNHFNHAAGIHRDKVVRMIRAIPMSHELIHLGSPGSAVLPIILPGLPPCTERTQSNPTDNHDTHGESYKEHPVDSAFGRRFTMDNNFTVALRVHFLRLYVSPGTCVRALLVDSVVIFLSIVLRLYCSPGTILCLACPSALNNYSLLIADLLLKA